MAHRKKSVLLTFISTVIGCALLFTIHTLKSSVKSSFESSISEIDILVGGANSSVNLLLNSVFKIGYPSKNIDYSLYLDLIDDPRVNYSIPISVGDSHLGYRVIGTTDDFFKHFKYANKRALSFYDGDAKQFSTRIDTIIIGSKIAKNLGYKVGDKIKIAHGLDSLIAEVHQMIDFEITGILNPTSTSVDQSLHVHLKALEAVHQGWLAQEDDQEENTNIENMSQSLSTINYSVDDPRLMPTAISFLFVNVVNKTEIFDVQTKINDNPGYTAVLSGIAFQQFWEIIKISDSIIVFISYLVLLSTMIAMICMMLNTLTLRTREIMIFRSLGSTPKDIALMLLHEGVINILITCIGGWCLCVGGLLILEGFISKYFGIFLNKTSLVLIDFYVVGSVIILGILISTIPAFSAYKKSIKQSIDEC